MLFLDSKYASLLNNYVRNFQKKDDYLWNFSCPICGDSKKNKRKARGYIYQWKETLHYKCHNCNYQCGIRDLLKLVSEPLYNDYVVEVYKERDAAKPVIDARKVYSKPSNAAKATLPPSVEEDVVDTILDGLKRIDKLPADHPARIYVERRKLPESALSLLYYTPRFKRYVNSVLPDKFRDIETDHPRLIIPYFNQHGAVHTFQGRAFGNEEPRYITIKVNPEASRIYGLERVNPAKRIYAVEGPLDSLCLPNTIAVSGSTFGSVTLELIRSNLTIVFDNEPRNPEISKLLKRVITKGFAVCIWPDTVTEKDINDMILSGMTAEDVIDIIDRNTFQGPAAYLKFTQWSKSDESRRNRKSLS